MLSILSRMIFLAVAVSASQLVAPLLRPTNSAAEVRRGMQQFEKKQLDQALKSFENASQLQPGPIASFNQGTAHVAAGNYAEGSQFLSRALEDATVRPDALYNRGNSSLSTNALDPAIHDYESTLKLRPGDRDAKRNLEIALLRKQAAQQPQPQPSQQPSPQQPEQDEEQPSPGDQREQESQEADAESLLRSVEQQEREELSRMHRARAAERRIGW